MGTQLWMKPYVALNIESNLSLRIWVGTVTTSVGMRMCDVPMGQRSVRGVSETFRNFFSKHVFFVFQDYIPQISCVFSKK